MVKSVSSVDIKSKGVAKKSKIVKKIKQAPKKSQNLSGQVIKSSKRSKKRTESYALYIYKVLKTVHPDVGVSRKAMGILNSFAIDVYDRISREAANLIRWSGKKTLSARFLINII